MEKLSSRYSFKNEYQDENENTQNVTVVLYLNNRTKNYSLSLDDNTIEQGFVFNNSNVNINKWNAILKSINEAIKFADIELGLS